MPTSAVALVAGVLLFQQCATLPGILWTALVAAVPVCVRRLPSLTPLWMLLLGFLWALLYAHLSTVGRLEPPLQGVDLLVHGVVSDIPDGDTRRTRFLFDVERLEINGVDHAPPGRVRLSWYDRPPVLKAGDRWRLEIRLRRPRGLMNPHGFDYEGWLFRQGIAGTGYVRDSASNRLLGTDSRLVYRINRFRQAIKDGITTQLGEGRNSAVLAALTIGYRGGLDASDWEMFRRTGTNHLVAISGLHIGIVAGIGFFAGRRLARILGRILNRVPADAFGVLLGLSLAIGYAALAGFSIPTRRALVMLSIGFCALLLRRPLRPFHALSAALAAVVLLDPLAVFSTGFWLSFGAVAAILSVVAWRAATGSVRSIGRMQWVVFVGLVPVLIASGMEVPIVSPAVNLLAVPYFSFLVVPAALVSTLLFTIAGDLAHPLLELSAAGIGLASLALELVADTAPRLHLSGSLSRVGWGVLTLGTLMMLAPRGMPGRWLGLLFFLPLFGAKGPAPPPGGLELMVLDVGQGLSVVVHTSDHTLVYDTGPRTYGGFDAGSSVVAPYLRGAGVQRVDRIVLSNGDSDHRGGLESVLRSHEAGEIYSGEPSALEIPDTRPCVAGEQWHWDDVRFKILHPPAGNRWRGNNTSCVVQIDTGKRRLLLTGDIERAAELQLVDHWAAELKSDLVIVPHHGSATSSTTALVKATRPAYAIVSAGYRNRYGFPKDAVVRRWRHHGARVLTTAESGALRFVVSPEGGLLLAERFRETGARYWTAP